LPDGLLRAEVPCAMSLRDAAQRAVTMLKQEMRRTNMAPLQSQPGLSMLLSAGGSVPVAPGRSGSRRAVLGSMLLALSSSWTRIGPRVTRGNGSRLRQGNID